MDFTFEDLEFDTGVEEETPQEVKDDVVFNEEITERNDFTSINGNDVLFGPSLPKQDESYVESGVIHLEGQSPLPYEYTVPSRPTYEHELEMWNIINNFEEDAWSEKALGLKTGFKRVDDAFEGGITPGFIVIAADSNVGKTGFMSQIAWQMVENNDDVYVMDFSLDDPTADKLARVIGSGSKVIINAVKNPQNYKDLPIMLGRRKLALNKLRENVDKYRVYDASFSTFIEDIEEEIVRKMKEFEALGLKKRIVVFIDNLYDLNIKAGTGGLDQRIKYDIIAQWCADTSIRYNIPVICTAELRKVNGAKRPELDDIRDCSKVKYEAKAVMMVYNEVHYKGEAAEVFFTRAKHPLKQPVLEVHFAKNKMSSFKGRLFFEMYPEMSYLEEPDNDTCKYYASCVTA